MSLLVYQSSLTLHQIFLSILTGLPVASSGFCSCTSCLPFVSAPYQSFTGCFYSFASRLLVVSTSLPVVSTCFCWFTNRFYSFLLVYQSFLLVSTLLPVVSTCSYSFTNRFYLFLLLHQSCLLFLHVYQLFQVLVLKVYFNVFQSSATNAVE